MSDDHPPPEGAHLPPVDPAEERDNPAGSDKEGSGDADMPDAQSTDVHENDRLVARRAQKTTKAEKCDGFKPKDVAAWCKALLWLLTLIVPQLTAPQLSIAFTMHLEGPALTAALNHFGAEQLRLGTVPAESIEDFLVRAYGRAKPNTNHSSRQQLQQLRPKKKADGSLDLLGFLQQFQQILSHCPKRPDDLTLIYWVMEQLPRHVRSLLHNDPATGQEFDSFQSFLGHATQHVAVYASSDQNKGNDRSDKGKDNGNSGGKRKANGHKRADKKPRPAPEDKPGYVPGLTPEERKRLQAEGLCFRCKKPGHNADNCKAGRK